MDNIFASARMPLVWSRANSARLQWWFTQYLFTEMPDNDVFNHLLIVAGETGATGAPRTAHPGWGRFGRFEGHTDDPRHALYPAGKFHHRRTVAAFGFHKAKEVRSSANISRLDTAYFAPAGWAAYGVPSGAHARCAAADWRSFLQCQPPFDDAAGDRLAIRPARRSLCSAVNSLIPLYHQPNVRPARPGASLAQAAAQGHS
ncbi:hypothetical protein KCP69_09255 [Salmonella enterica subsp. enterica]|nr:hypothetical protein KCP69_09255 [Salmonella enterica subsp. enterica]